jgi:hypothetical protein
MECEHPIVVDSLIDASPFALGCLLTAGSTILFGALVGEGGPTGDLIIPALFGALWATFLIFLAHLAHFWATRRGINEWQ